MDDGSGDDSEEDSSGSTRRSVENPAPTGEQDDNDNASFYTAGGDSSPPSRSNIPIPGNSPAGSEDGGNYANDDFDEEMPEPQQLPKETLSRPMFTRRLERIGSQLGLRELPDAKVGTSATRAFVAALFNHTADCCDAQMVGLSSLFNNVSQA